jgi:nickel-type superoxide dismutase maturation protease
MSYLALAHFYFFRMELPKINWKQRLLLFVGRRRLLRVEGDSMYPTLESGDAVLIDPQAFITTGDIVVANHPYKQSIKIIKRVESIDPGGRYILKGDNPDGSTDSRTYGTIAKGDIRGKVVCRISDQ